MMDMIQTTNISKTFKGVKAVNNLSISVPKGCIYGFLGPNGAGKTTTLKMLTGMIRPDSGEIRLGGEKIHFGRNSQFNQIGFLPDVPEYYGWMNPKEFLTLCGQLFGVEQHILNKRIDELLELTNIKTNAKIKGFSRGMKQRLGIAQALINEPSIVFLDEPTSALDPIGRKEILDLIYKLREKSTVFFSTHILSDVERICDRIAILDHGNMILEDTMAGIKGNHINNKIYIRTNENQQVKELLEKEVWVEHMDLSNLVVEVTDLAHAQKLIPTILSQNDLMLYEFRAIEPTLEDIFVKAVGI